MSSDGSGLPPVSTASRWAAATWFAQCLVPPTSYQSGDQDDLPSDVTGLELGERRPNVVERVGALDRRDEVARRYRLGQFGQGRRARRGRSAVALDAVLLDRGEVDDRVDPVPGDAEFERQLDVAVPDEVDERGQRRLLGGRGDAPT